MEPAIFAYKKPQIRAARVRQRTELTRVCSASPLCFLKRWSNADAGVSEPELKAARG
jgi:hypothetical protein